MADFLERTTDPTKPPLTFEDAGDFYSNASKLSATESSAINPRMYRKVGQFRDALNQSLEQAADQAGKLDRYRGAMGEYRTAMRAQTLAKAKNA